MKSFKVSVSSRHMSRLGERPGMAVAGLYMSSVGVWVPVGLVALLGCHGLDSEGLEEGSHAIEVAMPELDASPMVGGSCGPAAALSDEFEDACTLAAYQQSGLTHADVDIDTRTQGHLTLTWRGTAPAYSGWYQDYHGALLSKAVTGDFIARTRLNVRDAADLAQTPSQTFNSVGLLARDPASVQGDENWIAYNLGFQAYALGTEAKTTQGSASTLYLTDTGSAQGELLMCRVGGTFRLFRLIDGATSWVLDRTFERADLPQTLNVGIMSNAWEVPADIRAEVDYLRFSVPSGLADCTVEALNQAYPPSGCAAAQGFSDEFEDPCSLSAWAQENLSYTETDIDDSVAGNLSVRFLETTPRYSAWYENYTAPLLHKPVTGNFLVVTRVNAHHVEGEQLAPSSWFNSAGLMMRDPASVGGNQNWLVYNLGYQFEFVGTEGKTTDNSSSVLTLLPTDGRYEGRLAACRYGATFRMFRHIDGDAGWRLDHTYQRADLPATLDVGLMANVWELPATTHAEFEYVRLTVPTAESDCSVEHLNAVMP